MSRFLRKRHIHDIQISALAGSTQRFTKNLGNGRHEELTVTVKASPAK